MGPDPNRRVVHERLNRGKKRKKKASKTLGIRSGHRTTLASNLTKRARCDGDVMHGTSRPQI